MSIDRLFDYSTVPIQLMYVRANGKDSTNLNELFFLHAMRKDYNAPLGACRIYMQGDSDAPYSTAHRTVVIVMDQRSDAY